MRYAPLIPLFAIGAAAAVVSCALSLDGFSGGADPAAPSSETSVTMTDGSEAGADATSVDAGLVDGAAPSTTGCGGRPGIGSTMVRVLDAGFCMDTTEVSLDQYAAFLADNFAIPSECGWKNNYTAPAFTGPAAIGNVDWCDAFSYCKWAGKRLCGGRSSVVLDLTNSLTMQSEWQYACTHGGNPSFSYPYGNQADPTICLYGDSPDSGQARAIASNPKCIGPTDIFDLSGNVWEWEDACDRGSGVGDPNANCNLRGGGFLRDSHDWGSCAAVPSGWARNSHVDDTGIRCCSDYTSD